MTRPLLSWTLALATLAGCVSAAAADECRSCLARHASYTQYGPPRSPGQDHAYGRIAAHGGVDTCLQHQYLQPDLFYNYYQGGNCGAQPAKLYLAPYDTPPVVGHTYYTYQPLLPHEYMYTHHRTYRNYYNHNLGMTRTRAVYWSSPVRGLLWDGWNHLGFPRQ